MRSVLRSLLLLGALSVLAGCGFALRTSQNMPFTTIAVTPERGTGVAADLARYLGESVRPVAPGAGAQPPDVILDVLQDLRQKNAVGVNTSGLVREYELRLKVQFRLRTPDGHELIAPTPIELVRSISFNESVVLAKEAEEALLYRDMQSDVVQQLVRRLSTVKMPVRPAQASAAAASAAASAPGF